MGVSALWYFTVCMNFTPFITTLNVSINKKEIRLPKSNEYKSFNVFWPSQPPKTIILDFQTLAEWPALPEGIFPIAST